MSCHQLTHGVACLAAPPRYKGRDLYDVDDFGGVSKPPPQLQTQWGGMMDPFADGLPLVGDGLDPADMQVALGAFDDMDLDNGGYFFANEQSQGGQPTKPPTAPAFKSMTSIATETSASNKAANVNLASATASEAFGFGTMPPMPHMSKPWADSYKLPPQDSDAVSVTSTESGYPDTPRQWTSNNGVGPFGRIVDADVKAPGKVMGSMDLGSGPPPVGAAKRRDRNAREQARSMKISQQIGRLKEVMEQEGRSVKNSKMSVLVGVEQYIRDLEHEVSNLNLSCQKKRSQMDGNSTAEVKVEMEDHYAPEHSGQGQEQQVVSGVDYRTLFRHVCIPMAVATLDGRLVDSNTRFEMALGYMRDELHRLTLFNLLAPEVLQETFEVVAKMINIKTTGGPTKITRLAQPNPLPGMSRPAMLYLTISVVRSPDGAAKFFQCSLE